MDVTHTQAVRGRLATLGVSQHALARALGISQATLSLWLNGYRQPPTGFEAEAAAALDLLQQAERAATEARAQVLAGRRTRRVGAWLPHARRPRRTTDESVSVRH